MIKHTMPQGSAEWLAIRAGIPTASELDAIITPLWVPRKGEGVETYLAKKLAERWLGHPLQSFCGGAMDQGKIREEEAIPWYEFENSVEIERIGFITTDDGKFGCSPDGLLGDDGGIEVKCPEPHTHCKYLITNELPKDYAAQVHGSIAVTGAVSWKFMSYARNLPPLILTINRDEKIVASILDAVDEFNIKLDKAYQRLCEINGGEPDRLRFKESVTPRNTPDPFAGVTVDEKLFKEWMAT